MPIVVWIDITDNFFQILTMNQALNQKYDIAIWGNQTRIPNICVISCNNILKKALLTNLQTKSNVLWYDKFARFNKTSSKHLAQY